MTDPRSDKAALRGKLLQARRALSAEERSRAAEGIRAVSLDLGEVSSAGTVAAYVSVGTEPGTSPLIAALHDRGTRVLLPVLRADLDLDWAAYDGPGSLAPADRGLREPRTERLGREAVAAADVVIVPGLAADRSGHRLGRGGGSYDRALDRVPAHRLVVVLLYDGEVLPGVPAEPHDRRVDAAVTPAGVYRFGEHARFRPVTRRQGR